MRVHENVREVNDTVFVEVKATGQLALMLEESLGFDAEEAMKRLSAQGVGTRPFFYPMHQQPVLRRMGWFAGERCPVAERLYEQGFYVPSGLGLSESNLVMAAKLLKKKFWY
jgi:perosamine synthetase